MIPIIGSLEKGESVKMVGKIGGCQGLSHGDESDVEQVNREEF